MKKAISIFSIAVFVLGVVGPAKAENRLVMAAGITQGTADSLYVNESGDTMTGPLLLPDGSSGSPSTGFASEPGTGWWLSKALRQAWTIEGTGTVMTLDTVTGLVVDVDLTVGSTSGNTATVNAATWGFSNNTIFNFGANTWTINSVTGGLIINAPTVFDGTFELKGTDGIEFNPGVGVDTSLLSIQVATTPTLGWLTATSEFNLNRGLRVPEIGMGTTPNADALMHVVSTTQVAIGDPVMTSTQRDLIASGTPPEGSWVFDSTNNVPNYFNGTGWRAVLNIAASSLTSGCIPFADSVNSLDDDVGLTWENTDKILAAKNVTLNGRLQGDQGADVASADEIALGTGGNYFDITGTTTINHITKTGWQAGAVVVLQFDASVTVTHNAESPAGTEASILLSGAGDFSAAADDTLQLVYDGTTFREISRTVI